jgi:hypothetical protein
MNKKTAIVLLIVMLLLLFLTIYSIYAILSSGESKEEENDNIVISEKVEDECTEEYMENETAKITSISEEKVSANAILILKKYYTKCEHTINEYVELPKELVNLNKEEVEKQYPEWKAIGFSPEKITLYKEFDDICGEHFKIKVEDGKIVIYLTNKQGIDEVYLKTNISSEYLTETDLINMKDDGLEIYGKEELNKIIEDFE